MNDRCSHLGEVKFTRLPDSVDGCKECLRDGTKWLHLRICLVCGHVGCCDSSPERHATRHYDETGHPLIRSIEPGEEWSWCFADGVPMMIEGIEGRPTIPPSPLGG